MNNKKEKKKEERDEVEELLRAAEDEMLLKISVDSHMSRVSPSYIDPDLHRRFLALKKPSSSSSSEAPVKVILKPKLPQLSPETTITTTEKKPKENDELKGVLGDDLFARFAVLKGSLPSFSSSSSTPPKTSDGCDQFNQPNRNGGDEDDEVEKIIQWAIDAARLDPSSPTDDDGDDDDDDKDDDDGDDDDKDDDDGSDDEDGDRVEGDKRGQRK